MKELPGRLAFRTTQRENPIRKYLLLSALVLIKVKLEMNCDLETVTLLSTSKGTARWGKAQSTTAERHEYLLSICQQHICYAFETKKSAARLLLVRRACLPPSLTNSENSLL
jgi:hypothetical protein